MMVPVILSGGAGTRLWPLSRSQYPKQLLALHGEHSLLQQTLLRLKGLADLAAPLVVCNEQHRFMVAEQLRQVEHRAQAIILEPCGRNTAPAVAVAALQLVAHDPQALMLVLPADHVIRQPQALVAAIDRGMPLARQGKLVTFGIVPDHAETGYGYIRGGQPCHGAFEIEAFVEKPDRQRAEHYLASGDYYWNSGMFLLRADRYLQELEARQPELITACRQALAAAQTDLDFTRLAQAPFAACDSISIDYAVMEHTRHGVVVPLDAGWSDVGSWSALWQIGQHDDAGNVCRGDVLTHATRNSYVCATQRLVATVGVDDLVVVETADAVLVAAKDRVQQVKRIVDQLKERQRDEVLMPQRVHRPWGAYECIDEAPRFKVKRITVHPGASLSLQRHRHRAEHWIVVKGTARITRGDEQFLLAENESTYIPVGQKHRLENPGKIDLELIEVQSGDYLGEDDIVRFDDQYGRDA